MKAEKLSTEIAALERQSSKAKNAVIKKVIAKKIDKLKSELESITSEETAKENIKKAKTKVNAMDAKQFEAYIQNLAKDPKFSFLKNMTSSEIVRDMKRTAKPVGWRFRGRANSKTPTKKDIKDKNNVYYEGRRNRSDVSRKIRLVDGGGVGHIEVVPISDDDKLNILIKKKNYSEMSTSEKMKFFDDLLKIKHNGETFTAVGYESVGKGSTFPLEEAKENAKILKKAYPNYDFIVKEVIGNWAEKDITKKSYVVMSNRKFSQQELGHIKPFVKFAGGGGVDMNDWDMPVIRTQFEDEEFEYAKGGETGEPHRSIMASKGMRLDTNWNGNKRNENWGKYDLQEMYSNNLDLCADLYDYFKQLSKDTGEFYSNEMKDNLIEVLKTGNLKGKNGKENLKF